MCAECEGTARLIEKAFLGGQFNISPMFFGLLGEGFRGILVNRGEERHQKAIQGTRKHYVVHEFSLIFNEKHFFFRKLR